MPGADQHRAFLDLEQAGDDTPLDPHRPVLTAIARPAVGNGTLHLRLDQPDRQSRWTSTRKERLATTLVCRSRRRESPREDRLRVATAPTARTAATVAAPARTPHAAR